VGNIVAQILLAVGMTMAEPKEDIWALADFTATREYELCDAATVARINAKLVDHQIERFERPSPNPGVYGNRGASPEQLAFQKVFEARKHRIYAALGANQCGKTELLGGMCFCKDIRDNAQDGHVYWVVAQRNEDLRNIPAKTIWNFLPRSMFPEGTTYEPKLGFGSVQTLKLKLPDDRGYCEVWFRSEEMDLNIYESARCNGLWWTECSRESIFDALQPRLAARGGYLLMDYVPRHAWLKMRVHAGANPYIHVLRLGMRHNAHNLNPGEIEYQRTVLTDEQFRVRVLGEDGADFGVVFKEFRNRHTSDNGHICDSFPLPPEWPAWVYIDVGKYTAALLLAVSPEGKKYVVDESYTLGLNVAENAEAIKSMLARHGRSVDRIEKFKMDPAAWAYTSANRENVAEQYHKQGIPASGWTPVQSYGEIAMLDKARVEFMHDRLMVCQRCEKTTMELATWRHKMDRDGRVDPNERYEGPNHAIDALKCWVMTDPTFHQAELQILDDPEAAY
jgi:hypothetical protein